MNNSNYQKLKPYILKYQKKNKEKCYQNKLKYNRNQAFIKAEIKSIMMLSHLIFII